MGKNTIFCIMFFLLSASLIYGIPFSPYESYEQAVDAFNPIANWHFAEDSGTTAYDSAGSLNGSYSGATPGYAGADLTGMDGKAVRLDGNDYVHFSSGIVSGTGSFTLMAWVKTSSAGEQYLIQQRDGSSTSGEYVFEIISGQVRYWEYNGGYGLNFATSKTIADNQWHHIVFVRSGNTGSIYIDGALSASATGGPSNLSSARVFAIGKDYRDNTRFLTGYIDEVSIYNSALSTTSVEYLYGAAYNTAVPEPSVLLLLLLSFIFVGIKKVLNS